MRIVKLVPLLLAALPLLVSAKNECSGGQIRCRGNVMQHCETKTLPYRWKGNNICPIFKQCFVVDEDNGKKGWQCGVPGHPNLPDQPAALEVCVPESHRCDDFNKFQECDSRGAWKTVKHCEEPMVCHVDESVKNGGECRPAIEPRLVSPDGCVPNSHRCHVRHGLQECTARGAWHTVKSCSKGTVCRVDETHIDGGECRPFLDARQNFATAVNTSDAEQCTYRGERGCGANNTIEECDSNLNWFVIKQCKEDMHCFGEATEFPNGECRPLPVTELCPLNATRCHNNKMQTCTEPNKWKTVDHCPEGLVCQQDCGIARCNLYCSDPAKSNLLRPECVPGARQCDATQSRILSCNEYKAWETVEICPQAGDCKIDETPYCERPPLPAVESAPPKSSESSASSISQTMTLSTSSELSPPFESTAVWVSVITSSSSIANVTTSGPNLASPSDSTTSVWSFTEVIDWTKEFASLTVTMTKSSSITPGLSSTPTTLSSAIITSVPSFSFHPVISPPASSRTPVYTPSCSCPSIDPTKPGPPPTACTCQFTPSSSSRRVAPAPPTPGPPGPPPLAQGKKPRADYCDTPGNDRCVYKNGKELDVIQKCFTKDGVQAWYDVITCPVDTICWADIDEATGTVIASCNVPPSIHEVSETCTPGERSCSWDFYTLLLCNDQHKFQTEKKCTYPGDCKIDGPGLAHCERGGISPPKARRQEPPISWGQCSAEQSDEDICATGADGIARILKCIKGVRGQGWIWYEEAKCHAKEMCELDNARGHCAFPRGAPTTPEFCQLFDKICDRYGNLLTCNVEKQQFDLELICTEGGSCVEDSPRRARCERGGVHPPPSRPQEDDNDNEEDDESDHEEEEGIAGPITFGPCFEAQEGLQTCYHWTDDNIWRVLTCGMGPYYEGYHWYQYTNEDACHPGSICEDAYGTPHCSANLTLPNDPPGCEKWDKICSWDHKELLTCNFETQSYDVELTCAEGGSCVEDSPRRARCDPAGLHPPPPDHETPRLPGICKISDKKCSEDGDFVLACDVQTQEWYKEMTCIVRSGLESRCVYEGPFQAHCRYGDLGSSST